MIASVSVCCEHTIMTSEYHSLCIRYTACVYANFTIPGTCYFCNCDRRKRMIEVPDARHSSPCSFATLIFKSITTCWYALFVCVVLCSRPIYFVWTSLCPYRLIIVGRRTNRGHTGGSQLTAVGYYIYIFLHLHLLRCCTAGNRQNNRSHELSFPTTTAAAAPIPCRRNQTTITIWYYCITESASLIDRCIFYLFPPPEKPKKSLGATHTAPPRRAYVWRILFIYAYYVCMYIYLYIDDTWAGASSSAAGIKTPLRRRNTGTCRKSEFKSYSPSLSCRP